MQRLETSSKPRTFRLPPAYITYLWLVGGVGFALLVWASQALPQLVMQPHFLMLAALVVIAQFTTYSLAVSGKAGVTYSISAALTIAALPLFGLEAAILLELVSTLSVALIKSADETTWKKRIPQFVFNLGMVVIATFMAAQVYSRAGGSLADNSTIYFAVIWLFVAIVYDQCNLWLVIVILRLQHGTGLNPVEVWRSNYWASSIAIGNVFVGAGIFVLAVYYLGTFGIVAFSAPILLTAFAFRTYISETKKQMANLQQIIDEHTRDLKQLNEEKDAFLAVLTHDMKSPLTSIGINATMLQRYPDLFHKKPHMMSNILRSQVTLLDLVNNVVDLEKLRVGSVVDLDRSPFELNELTEFVSESLQAQALASDITLNFHASPLNTRIVADRSQIERILTNLMNNAVKYTANNGQVDVRVEADLEKICVVVSDTGYGIPADELPYIFDRYRRVRQHRHLAIGTGLGLAIAKGMAEAHGGTILVESVEDEGSTFTLELPWDSAE